MKKIILAIPLLLSLLFSAQQKNKNILYSQNIPEIESFLKEAHPEDPRRIVLKPKLVALKNAAWMKVGRYNLANLNSRYREIPKILATQKDDNEEQEFQHLIAENSTNHKEKTVRLLNQLFENDITNKETIILMQNNSNCNMIVRIEGKEFYNLPVPMHGENSLVIKKGDYQLRSNVCEVTYNTTKNIAKNTLVVINNPVVNFENTTFAQNKNGAAN